MKAPAPESVAKFTRWIVLIFLGYALFHTTFGAPKKPVTPAAVAAKTKDCGGDNALSNGLSTFAIPLIPSYTPSLHIDDTKPGEGLGASCGQHATLRYEYATRSGGMIYSDLTSTGAPQTVTIGGTDLLPGLERGLLGMKPGGERTITMPPMLGFGDIKDIHTLRGNEQFKISAPSDVIVAKASLLALSPGVPESAMPIRMLNGVFGSGDPVQCGDKVRADITIWKLDGTQLFSTTGAEPLTFTLGDSQLPFGMEEGIAGMRLNGQRTLIIPPAYNQPLDSAVKQLLPAALPQEIVLAEITLRPLNTNPPAAAKTTIPVTAPSATIPPATHP